MLGGSTVYIERDGFHRFCQFSAHIGCRVLRHQSPAVNVVDVPDLLLLIAVLQRRCREITHTPVFLTTLHQVVGQQQQIGVHHCRHVDLGMTLSNGGRQFRLGHHTALVSLHTDDA